MRKKVVLLVAVLVLGLPALFFASGPVSAGQARITVSLDKEVYTGSQTVTIKGTAPKGKPVYIEIASENKVKVSRLDTKTDPKTGKKPYIFYTTKDIPAAYTMLLPTSDAMEFQAQQKLDKKWSVGAMLKNCGAVCAYLIPAKADVQRYQASILATIMGSKGNVLPAMDGADSKKATMPLLKTRYRWPERIFSPTVNVNPDGTFSATYKLPESAPNGAYTVTAAVDKDTVSAPVTFTHNLSFGRFYFSTAGQSMGIIGPFLLSLVVCTFGVLIGAGGGFILTPLLLFIYGLPHTVVAGSVLPSVLFSQGTGIYNYSKIKFINWKLGISVGLAMLVGGFIGPKLTEIITLSQFKFLFGWVLIILAAIMYWQTTPGRVANNKKEQAILKEYKKRAQADAAAKTVAAPKTA